MDRKRHSRGWLPWAATIGMVLLLAVMWYSDEIIAKAKSVWDGDSGISAVFDTDKTDIAQSSVSAAKTDAEEESAVAQQLKETVVREPLVTLKGDGKDEVTVLVYMNGSDLETEDGQGTIDIGEMLDAGSGGNVNVLVETIGTKRWKSTYGISNKTAQRYAITDEGFTLVKDNLGSLAVGEADNLEDFIRWGAKEYPADRYILILWNHGSGPVYGYGYDDKTGSEDTLTTYEIRQAVADAGVTFDIIGMDCCIMSSLELCCALYDYCDYTILSEDFESGYGWYYTDWLKLLRSNPSVSSLELGKQIVDDTVSVNKRHGQDSILAVLDEAYMKVLYSAWVNFAYANEDTLLGTNYSRSRARKPGGRISTVLEDSGFFKTVTGPDGKSTLQEYYLTDILAVAQNVTGEEATFLTSVLTNAVAYMNAYGDSVGLTGLCVTLPYGDSGYYRDLQQILTDCGFDSEYITWLKKFVSSSGSSTYYDYDEWDDEWSDSGWGSYSDYYGDDWIYSLFGGYEGEYDDGYYDEFEDWGGGWGWSGR